MWLNVLTKLGLFALASGGIATSAVVITKSRQAEDMPCFGATKEYKLTVDGKEVTVAFAETRETLDQLNTDRYRGSGTILRGDRSPCPFRNRALSR